MGRIYFSFTSTLGLASVILGLVLSFYLLRIRGQKTHARLLAMIFLNFTAMMAGFTLLLSVEGDWALNGVTAILLLIDVGILLLLQFAYRFPSNTRPTEAKVVLVASLMVLLLVAASVIWLVNFDEHGWTASFERLVIIVLAVQVVRFFEYLFLFYVWPHKILHYEHATSRPFFKKLLMPHSAQGKTIRAFVITFSIGLVIPVSPALYLLNVVSVEEAALIFVLGANLILAVFFITYINYLPEQSGFMVKLVGVNLGIVLATVAVTGYLIDTEAQETYRTQRLSDIALTRSALTTGELPQIPGTVSYVISRPLDQSGFRVDFARAADFDVALLESWEHKLIERQVWTEAWTSRLLQPSLTPNEARIQAAWEVHKKEPILLTPLERAPDMMMVGVRERDVHYDYIEGHRLYQVGFSYLAGRAHLHVYNLMLVCVMIGTTLAMLVFFPLFFKRGLTKPLKDLLMGVSQVNEGRFDVCVPIHAHDEFGTVAEAFNKMVGSISEAREKALAQERERAHLHAENERKTRELEDARRLQLSLLPKHLPQLPDLVLAAYTNPATEVGGDYYDFHVNGEGILTAVIGDATGHGLQAGTMVTATKSLFNALAPQAEPICFLVQTSAALYGLGFESMLMALLVARVRGDQLLMTSAGMPYSLLYRAETKTVEQVVLKGLPLGSGLDFPYQKCELTFLPGDTLLLLSDGLEECFNPKDEMLGAARVRTRFTEIGTWPAQQIIEDLVALGNGWADGRAQDDDITMVVIKKTEA